MKFLISIIVLVVGLPPLRGAASEARGGCYFRDVFCCKHPPVAFQAPAPLKGGDLLFFQKSKMELV